MKNKNQVDKLSNIVVYDYMQVHGGAEIVTKEILEGLECDKLITAFSNSDTINSLKINRDKVTNLSTSTNSTPLAMLKAFWKFATFRANTKFNTVIVSGIFAPLLARRVKANKIIYYCHTPPRFLFDLKDHYRQSMSISGRLFLKLFSLVYKPLYVASFEHIDIVLANSNNVKKRLKNYLNIDSEILYPPCNTSYIGKESKGYFLSTARVERLKRVDMIVDAFMHMPDKQLIVMSGGSLLEELKVKAKNHSNISFTGWVTEEEKRDLIAHCEATIYIPKDEDFGMSPVESISAGKPVIGVAEGGLLETIKHYRNGLLIKSASISSIIDAASAHSLPKPKNAPNFERHTFITRMKHAIKEI